MTQEIKFGTDGWRAIIAEGFTFDNVNITSKAIGKFVLKNLDKNLPVLIGYDTRFLASQFARSCATVLTNLELNVHISSDVIPTPVLAFSASNTPTNGAIQFTASHNPPEYCGIKYITNYGGPASIEITDEITKYIKEQHNQCRDMPWHVSKEIETFDPKTDYIKHLKKLVDFDLIKKSNLKVVYDPMYGAGINYLDHILKEASCQTTTIHNKKDPLFGGLLPEPKEEYLNDLKLTVKSTKSNIGLATDGDSDRIGAIDQDGTYYSPNKISSMLLRHLVKNKKLNGKVVRTLSTTHLMDHLAKKYNLELVETQVGFKWICEEMRRGNVLIGAEESGGISILNHIPDKDAILAGMLIVEMLAFERKSLKEIYKETIIDANWSCVNDRFDLHLNDKQKNYLISELKSGRIKELNGLKISSINTIEGAKYLFEDGSWFLARASGTEPMARVYFEATSDRVLETMKSVIKRILEKIY